ncbi:MAG: hypothetical protein FWH00_04060, partial [Oscillospiraceae bacterium]|nr:hypothetical protein [Oscillospiraceae bacterium]
PLACHNSADDLSAFGCTTFIRNEYITASTISYVTNENTKYRTRSPTRLAALSNNNYKTPGVFLFVEILGGLA